MTKKLIRVGLDLDGVLVDKPPFVPKKVLEWLVRSHQTKKLAYRYPTLRLERWLRWFSHHPIFRSPIGKNLEFVKNLNQSEQYQFYLISGRYSFLQGRTWQWLKYHQLDGLLAGVFINLANQQPHLFKEKMIKELKIDIFVDDDLPLAEYLASQIKRRRFFCFGQKPKSPSGSKVTLIGSLEGIFNQ